MNPQATAINAMVIISINTVAITVDIPFIF
jgi:hypothetical protein